MKRETEIDLIARLLAHVDAGTTSTVASEAHLPVAHYRSRERFDDEGGALFRRLPIVVGHVSEVAAPGSFFTHDTLGVPLLVARDRDGKLGGFLNVCRHRGARLVREPRGEDRKAFSCGYHAWTYGLDGPLLHVPHAELFDPSATCNRGLVPVPVAELGGLVWAAASPRGAIDVGAFLGPLAEEIDGLALADHVPYRTVTVTRGFNWKLIIDAFLDGSHIRQLHRGSVARFFLDNVNLVDAFSPHIRSAVARRAITETKAAPRETWKLREVLSLTYFLFPNTVLVLHPDYVSRITVFPVSERETAFTHTMLIPRGEDPTARRDHWEKSWALIHGQVFEQEDMVACEWIQGGLDSGANEVFVCGKHEHPIALFHEAIERAIGDRNRLHGDS